MCFFCYSNTAINITEIVSNMNFVDRFDLSNLNMSFISKFCWWKFVFAVILSTRNHVSAVFLWTLYSECPHVSVLKAMNVVLFEESLTKSKKFCYFESFVLPSNYSNYTCWVFIQECHQSSNKSQFPSGLCQPKSQRMALFRKGCHGYFAEVDGTRQDQSNRVQKSNPSMFTCFHTSSFCNSSFQFGMAPVVIFSDVFEFPYHNIADTINMFGLMNIHLFLCFAYYCTDFLKSGQFSNCSHRCRGQETAGKLCHCHIHHIRPTHLILHGTSHFTPRYIISYLSPIFLVYFIPLRVF